MRFAIGTIYSPGFNPPVAFWRGRADAPEEGFCAIERRIVRGDVNRSLGLRGFPHLQLTGYRAIESRQFPTSVARNEICASVLAGDEDYLLFLDADMVHPADLVERLLVHEKPVITARYHLKKAPWNPVCYVKHRVLDGAHAYTSVHFGRGVFEVERGGAGALLIRRDVIDAIYRAHGHNWFQYQREPTPPHDYKVSEDFWFWRCARELGFGTYVDWDVVCPHVTEFPVDDAFFDTSLNHQAMDAMQQGGEVWEKWKSHAVVCGFEHGMVMPNGDTVPPYAITPGER